MEFWLVISIMINMVLMGYLLLMTWITGHIIPVVINLIREFKHSLDLMEKMVQKLDSNK